MIAMYISWIKITKQLCSLENSNTSLFMPYTPFMVIAVRTTLSRILIMILFILAFSLTSALCLSSDHTKVAELSLVGTLPDQISLNACCAAFTEVVSSTVCNDYPHSFIVLSV